MDPDVARIAQLLVVFGTFGGGVVALGLVTRVVLAWTRRPAVSSVEPVTGVDDGRFARLEQAVEAIAVEVERVAEAQRFTTQLLSDRALRLPAERGEPDPTRKPGWAITPH